MELGNRIKKCRESINLSQEELADKIYVSRQTISNWENNKSYPDINSLKLLSNVFDVSLDNFIKGDIEEMKKKISDNDLKEYNRLSIIYIMEFLVMLFSAYPLFKIFKIMGVVIWVFICIISLITAFKIEKIYKENDVRTYKEIVAFVENKNLSHDEKIEEKAKRPYQKFLLSILSGIIAIVVFVILDLIFG